jgi:hypothetical protein
MNGSEELLQEQEYRAGIEAMPDRKLLEETAMLGFRNNHALAVINLTVYGMKGQPDGGLCERMDAVEKTGKDNRHLIIAMWGILLGMGGAIMGMFLAHINATKDAVVQLFHWGGR